MKETPFLPRLASTRHVPGPSNADMMGRGDTPGDFLPQPQATPWNADPQGLPYMTVEWSPVDATQSLADQGYVHDMLGVIPEVANFDSGPGDKTPSAPGWM